MFFADPVSAYEQWKKNSSAQNCDSITGSSPNSFIFLVNNMFDLILWTLFKNII